MDNSRPQLNPEDFGRIKWLCGSALALLGSWTVFFMDVAAWGLLLAINIAVAAALIRPGWPAVVPRWIHVLAFPVIVIAFVYDLYIGGEPLASLIRLDLMLILYRICSFRQRRDDLQLIVLCLFLIVVAGVLTVSLAFAVQIVAFTGVALAFLFAITLSDAAAPAAVAASVDQGPTPASARPAWTHGRWSDLFRKLHAVTDWRLVVFGGVLFAGVVALSGFLFLAIPRFELGNTLGIERWINRTVRTGFSETVQFGEVTDITQDNRLALQVDVTDREAMPADPYWRMVVLDEYTATGFAMSRPLKNQLNLPQVAPRTRENGTARARADQPRWTFYFEAGVSRYLPLLGSFYSITFTEPQQFVTNPDLQVVALKSDPAKMFAYQVYGMGTDDVIPDATYTLHHRNPGSTRRPAIDFLSLPSLSPDDLRRVSGFLDEIGRGTNTVDFMARATRWLQTRHAYSLQSQLPPGENDPLVRWMASEEPGHCEFFAGSLVVLARAAGYPARLITGFRGGTWNGYSDSFTVRNANAHAWCELFDDAAQGWRRADPTPGGGAFGHDPESGELIGANTVRPPDTGWQARLESLRVFWYRRIVNFDQSTQVEMLEATKNAFKTNITGLIKGIDARLDSLKTWLRQPWGGSRWITFGGGLLLAGGLIWAWRVVGKSWWLRWRSAHARSAEADPVRRQAGLWLRRLDRLPPAAANHFPAALRADLQRLRYGDRRGWPDPAATLRRTKVDFRAARRAKATASPR